MINEVFLKKSKKSVDKPSIVPNNMVMLCDIWINQINRFSKEAAILTIPKMPVAEHRVYPKFGGFFFGWEI